jgi:hypothetical protein
MVVDTLKPAVPPTRRDELALSDRALRRIERFAAIGLLVVLFLIGTALPYL